MFVLFVSVRHLSPTWLGIKPVNFQNFLLLVNFGVDRKLNWVVYKLLGPTSVKDITFMNGMEKGFHFRFF